MITADDTRIHGLGTEWASDGDGVDVNYVYPGAPAIHLAEAVSMAGARPQIVKIGTVTADPDTQDLLDEKFWRWPDSTSASARIWARHVLDVNNRGVSAFYEHDGTVTIVLAKIPTRVIELELLREGFQPALATWTAPTSPQTFTAAKRLITGQLSPSAAPYVADATTLDLGANAEHAWMRWCATFDERVVRVGERIYQKRRGTPYRQDDKLVLEYAVKRDELRFTLTVSLHPVLYDVAISARRGDADWVSARIINVSWEGFPDVLKKAAQLVEATQRRGDPKVDVPPAVAPSGASALDDARLGLKTLALPPKKYAYYMRRAEEAIADGKGWAPIVARARRAAERLAGVPPNTKRPAPNPRPPPSDRPAGVDTVIDSFNREPTWRAEKLRPRASGFVLVIYPEGKDMSAAVASVDVVHGEVDELRWLDVRLTHTERDNISERLDRALWDAHDDGDADTGEEDASPRRSPLQDLIELMERRSGALGARAANTANLAREDGYRHIAEALRDLAKPSGPGVEELQRWLESEKLMAAGEIVGRARGAEATSPRRLLSDIWGSVFEVLTLEEVSGRPGALVVPDEAIFREDDVEFVLQRVHEGERFIVRRVRVRVGKHDEQTGTTTIEDPTDRLTPAANVHRTERTARFYADLYGKLGAFHEDLQRAPKALQDVRTLLYWSAVMLDAPLCQGEVKVRAAAAFTQAKAYHDSARRQLLEGQTVDAVRRIHEALRRISTAAAELARSCGDGQITLPGAAPALEVTPSDKAALASMKSPRLAGASTPRAAMHPSALFAGAAMTLGTRGGRDDLDDQLNELLAKRFRDNEPEITATFDRLLKIYSGGRLGSRSSERGVMVVERVNRPAEFPSLELPNLAAAAAAIPEGATVGRVDLAAQDVLELLELADRGHRALLNYGLIRAARDGRASIVSRWIRPPTDQIEIGGGAWNTDVYLPLIKNHTCGSCPFVLGSNLDCGTCRAWIMDQKVDAHVWPAAEIHAAIKPYCPPPEAAQIGAEALATVKSAPLTREFFVEWAAAFGEPIGELPDEPGLSVHCRRCVEQLFIRPDFALPEARP